jgi:hypothetical protein
MFLKVPKESFLRINEVKNTVFLSFLERERDRTVNLP